MESGSFKICNQCGGIGGDHASGCGGNPIIVNSPAPSTATVEKSLAQEVVKLEREADDLAHLCGQIIATIRVNWLRGQLTLGQVDDPKAAREKFEKMMDDWSAARLSAGNNDARKQLERSLAAKTAELEEAKTLLSRILQRHRNQQPVFGKDLYAEVVRAIGDPAMNDIGYPQDQKPNKGSSVPPAVAGGG